MNPLNKDTPVLRTEFSSPISVLIRGVSLYILSCLDQFPHCFAMDAVGTKNRVCHVRFIDGFIMQVKDVDQLSKLKTLKIGNFRKEETTEAIRQAMNGKILVYYHLSEVQGHS